MRRALLGPAVALGLLGCGGREVADPCEAQMAALEARLTALAAGATPAAAPAIGALPASSRGVALEGTPPLVVVSTDEVLLGERGVGGLDDLERTAETLRADLRRWAAAEELPDDAPFLVALWVAPEVDAAALTTLLRHAPERARFALLVRGPALGALEGEPAWVADAVPRATGRPELLRQRLDAAWRRATESCPAARAEAPMPATLRPAGPPMGAPSVAGLMTALRACGCARADLVAVEAVARRALVDRRGPVRRLAATLRFGRPTDDAPAVEVAPDETVGALVARIDSREGPLWVRREP